MLACPRSPGRFLWKKLWSHHRNSGVRQNNSGRTDRGLQLVRTDHDSDRTGLPKPRQSDFWVHKIERKHSAVKHVLLVAFLVFLYSCSADNRSDPQETFEKVRLTFLHGDLVRAREEADKAYRQLSAGNQEWAWKFRLLEAEILTWQGLNPDVLAILDFELPPPFSNGD